MTETCEWIKIDGMNLRTQVSSYPSRTCSTDSVYENITKTISSNFHNSPTSRSKMKFTAQQIQRIPAKRWCTWPTQCPFDPAVNDAVQYTKQSSEQQCSTNFQVVLLNRQPGEDFKDVSYKVSFFQFVGSRPLPIPPVVSRIQQK